MSTGETLMAQRRSTTTTNEVQVVTWNGYLMLLVSLALIALPINLLIAHPPSQGGVAVTVLEAVAILVGVLFLCGLYVLQPKQAALLLLFGAYRGTDHAEGLRWANPFLVKKKVSLRAHNLNSEKIKVNDKRGNP